MEIFIKASFVMELSMVKGNLQDLTHHIRVNGNKIILGVKEYKFMKEINMKEDIRKV